MLDRLTRSVAKHAAGPLVLLSFSIALSFLVAAWGASQPASAEQNDWSVRIDRTFDHSTTKFPLTGAHIKATCESCHAKAVFKGLGTSCATCHGGEASTGPRAKTSKPDNHIPSSNVCSECHTTQAWAGARFKHGIETANCQTCHDGRKASGKVAGHVPTTTQCERCHTSQHWAPLARFDHNETMGSCGTCHDGVRTTGKIARHIPVNSSCDTCHGTRSWTPARFRHDGNTNCFMCHDGFRATGKPADHIKSTNACGDCHNTVAFGGGRFSHAGIVDNCASCHNGIKATGKDPNTHIPTTRPCEQCHFSTVTFKGAQIVLPLNRQAAPGPAGAR